MITLFTIPKPFVDPHTALIQRNALKSWQRLDCEIILLGRDEGVAEAARDFEVRHESGVDYSAEGAPLLASVIGAGNAAASHKVRCYVSADIILLPDFVKAAEIPTFERSLIVGKRWDVDLRAEVDFDRHDVKAYTLDNGREHGPFGLDYFIHTPDVWAQAIPPEMALGRMFWDNYLLCLANDLGVDTIDASEAIFAVHQNHDYRHQFKGGTEERWNDLADCRKNAELVGQSKHSVMNARWALGSDWVLRKR